MAMSLKRTVEPSATPVSLVEAKLHARIAGTDEDAILVQYLDAAVHYVEERLARQLIAATWRLKLDAFPACGYIELPRPPLQSVASVQYVDLAGGTQTLASTAYRVDSDSEPGRIVLNYGESWPSTRGQEQAVTITYTAGYGIAASAVPDDFRQAVLWMFSHLYETREPVNIGNIVNEISLTVDSFLADHCRGYGGLR